MQMKRANASADATCAPIRDIKFVSPTKAVADVRAQGATSRVEHDHDSDDWTAYCPFASLDQVSDIDYAALAKSPLATNSSIVSYIIRLRNARAEAALTISEASARKLRSRAPPEQQQQPPPSQAAEPQARARSKSRSGHRLCVFAGCRHTSKDCPSGTQMRIVPLDSGTLYAVASH